MIILILIIICMYIHIYIYITYHTTVYCNILHYIIGGRLLPGGEEPRVRQGVRPVANKHIQGARFEARYSIYAQCSQATLSCRTNE